MSRLRVDWLPWVYVFVLLLALGVSVAGAAEQKATAPGRAQAGPPPQAAATNGQDEPAKPCALWPADLTRLKWGALLFGGLFGFFLSYSIRSGSKTQDVFKGFIGVLGTSGTAAGAALLDKPCQVPVLGLYAIGAFCGFMAYVVAAVLLAYIFACKTGCLKPWAEILGRVILGEEFAPPARPGTPLAGGGAPAGGAQAPAAGAMAPKP